REFILGRETSSRSLPVFLFFPVPHFPFDHGGTNAACTPDRATAGELRHAFHLGHPSDRAERHRVPDQPHRRRLRKLMPFRLCHQHVGLSRSTTINREDTCASTAPPSGGSPAVRWCVSAFCVFRRSTTPTCRARTSRHGWN